MPAGRPTKYSKQMLELARDYVEAHDVKYGDIIPTVAGLSLVLDVTKKTIYNWISEGIDEQFLHCVDGLLAKQEKTLVAGGLMKEFDSGVARLLLNQHGYSQKTETDITTQGDKIQPLLVEFIDGNA